MVNELFLTGHTVADKIFSMSPPWELLGGLSDYIRELGRRLDKRRYEEISEGVWVAVSATVADTAALIAPTVIDEEAELRHGAFVRGSVIIGKECVVGNSTEIKNSVIFDGVQLPHYNYVGDSILGYRSHLGAGAIISNVRSDKRSVSVVINKEKVDTGRRKMGAILGDFVEVGSGAVLCPGCIIGRESIVYPLARVRGTVPEKSIYKGEGVIVTREDI